jgi:tellurite resistance protein
MAEAIQAEGLQGLNGMLEQMTAYKEMLEREQAQKAQHEAEQAAVDQAQSTEFGAFVETAYLIAAADGSVSDAESQRLSHGISQLTQGQLSDQQIQEHMQAAASRFQSEGRDGRIQAVASVISDPNLRRAALLVGAGVAWLDRGVGEKEGLALQAIARAFDIPINEMHKLLAQAKG